MYCVYIHTHTHTHTQNMHCVYVISRCADMLNISSFGFKQDIGYLKSPRISFWFPRQETRLDIGCLILNLYSRIY